MKRNAVPHMTDPDAERAERVADTHGDDRMIKIGIKHAGHGKQDPARQEFRFTHPY